MGMGKGMGATCAVAMLVIFNIIAGLAGAALLALGIWMLADEDITDKLELIKVVSDDDMMKNAAIVLCCIGGFAMVVAFLGCCGAIRKSKVLLGIYAFVLFVVMAGEIAGGILAIVYRNEVEDKLEDEAKEELLKDELVKNNDEGELSYTPFGLAMSIAQYEWDCCGISGPKDYENSTFVEQNTKGWAVLPTCCDDASSKSEKDPSEAEDCLLYSDKSGCQEELKDWFKEKAFILAGIAIAIGCIELFGFLFAIFLCRYADED